VVKLISKHKRTGIYITRQKWGRIERRRRRKRREGKLKKREREGYLDI